MKNMALVRRFFEFRHFFFDERIDCRSYDSQRQQTNRPLIQIAFVALANKCPPADSRNKVCRMP